jgi:hypothetical protein
VLGPSPGKRDEVSHRTFVDDRVRVEQEQILSRRGLRGEVDAGREADVLVEGDQARLGELCPNHVGGAVLRGVVDDDDLVVDPGRDRVQ